MGRVRPSTGRPAQHSRQRGTTRPCQLRRGSRHPRPRPTRDHPSRHGPALHAYLAQLGLTSTPPSASTATSQPAPRFNTPEWARAIGNELHDIKPTAGITFDDKGMRLGERFRSGEQDEWYPKVNHFLRQSPQFPNMPRPGVPVPSASHVEAKIAMHMRENGIQHRTVVINKEAVCVGNFDCWKAVQAIFDPHLASDIDTGRYHDRLTAIPLDQARTALHEFTQNHGQRPTSITWVAGDYYGRITEPLTPTDAT